MTKNFNFDNIGKRLPYTMPSETFNEMEANVFATLKQDKRRKKSYRIIRWGSQHCRGRECQGHCGSFRVFRTAYR